MTRIIVVLLSFYLQVNLFSQSGVKSNNIFVHPSLKKVWTCEKQFATPESVLYCKKENVLFVSNINGQPDEKDNNGFITKMSLDGKVIQLKWAMGLNAPKGMGIYKDKLYVADIDHLVEIDLKTGTILKQHKGKKASFLNDIAVGHDGTVYVSDMKNNIIYALKNEVFDVWLQVGNLFQPNGLLVENEKLLVGCMNYIVSVDLKTKHVRAYITETGSIDGLVKNGNEKYIISDWVGNIHEINKNAPKLKLLSTEQNNMNAADIEYISSKNLLIIPTFFDNRVIAYEVNL